MKMPYTTPASVGIEPQWLENFLKRLENQDIPMHSAVIMRHGKICMETYYAPYTADKLHRMFSITKTFVAIGIGLLQEEGKLSLDDKIVSYFPEFQPEGGPYEYTAMLTIRDMLKMKTCHTSTTFKLPGITSWVGSFFTTKPNHIPGTNFTYDTSSTHVLGALVEKLSGQNLLDYLRGKFYDEIGFSKDAYVLPDPQGVSQGGSGLCATTEDILKMGILIMNDGAYPYDSEGNPTTPKQLLPKDYIKEMKILHSDTYARQDSLEELQGYGYQIWHTRFGGIVLYGMGGQLVLYVPDKDIYMVTTADTQAKKGGVQYIYEAFWNEIYEKITDDCLDEATYAAATKELEAFCGTRKIITVPGNFSEDYLDKNIAVVNNISYKCDDNKLGITNLKVVIDKNTATANNEPEYSGSLIFTNKTGEHSIDFKFQDNAVGKFPDYDMDYAASAGFRMDNTLVIKVNLIDSSVGSIYICLNYLGDAITVMFRKIEETLFNEYNGVFSGRCE